MKVILVNGSPHPKGCTYTALSIVAEALNENGVGTEFFHVGTKPLAGCIDCRKCVKLGRCVFDDRVNAFLEIVESGDGFVFGSPVHYAAASGAMTSFMDRVFFSSFCSGRSPFRLKPGAVIVSARRSGTTAALDQLNKYLTWAEMPVVSSRYWNMVHGNTPGEVRQDQEGLQTMQVLGNNMAWLLRCLEAGRNGGITSPEPAPRVSTNFVR